MEVIKEETQDCIPGIPHAKPCGPIYAGGSEYYSDECSCGCSAYGDYCMDLEEDVGC